MIIVERRKTGSGRIVISCPSLKMRLAPASAFGNLASFGDIDRLTTLLGPPLRSYRDFATETAERWQRAAL